MRSDPNPGPSIVEYMSPTPCCIGREQVLTTAREMMRQHEIRHLPVLDGGRLVGVVSDRDLGLVETLREVDPRNVTVEEAMTADPLTVPPTMPLVDAARIMHAHRIGSVIVVERGKVVGVFTTTDALRALAHELAGRAPRTGCASAD
jgi:acetoin utilization protein AcuB